MKSLLEQDANLHSQMIIDDNDQNRQTYSRLQFMDMLASKVGSFYNLKDIRQQK